MKQLKYTVGDKLVSKKPNAKGKPIYAIVKKLDENPVDSRPYYTQDSEGTKKWWYPNELDASFRKAGDPVSDDKSDGDSVQAKATPDDGETGGVITPEPENPEEPAAETE